MQTKTKTKYTLADAFRCEMSDRWDDLPWREVDPRAIRTTTLLNIQWRGYNIHCRYFPTFRRGMVVIVEVDGSYYEEVGVDDHETRDAAFGMVYEHFEKGA